LWIGIAHLNEFIRFNTRNSFRLEVDMQVANFIQEQGAPFASSINPFLSFVAQ
jgi:hypothetical protein